MPYPARRPWNRGDNQDDLSSSAGLTMPSRGTGPFRLSCRLRSPLDRGGRDWSKGHVALVLGAWTDVHRDYLPFGARNEHGARRGPASTIDLDAHGYGRMI